MQQRIYFDNAATTQLDPDVLQAMLPYMTEKYGNPSSIYSYGRESRLAIENARKQIARILNAHPAEVFFTSGGTESSNTAIQAAVYDLNCSRIISSPIEHHAVLHTLEHLRKRNGVELEWVRVSANGYIDLEHLEELLKGSTQKTLVSLMHANNEIGNMISLDEVGTICRKYGAFFHSDTVQTVGHFPFNLRDTPVDFITGSAHKFHGPKGVGLLYINENVRISPFIHGGSQERNMRAGTENLYGIVGMAKALDLATQHNERDRAYIQSIKLYMKQRLEEELSDIRFNGDPAGSSLYTVLNVSLPASEKAEMLLFNLDIHNICASGGSACTSGADIGSHVVAALNGGRDRISVRFSFSKYNLKQEVDAVVTCLKELI